MKALISTNLISGSRNVKSYAVSTVQVLIDCRRVESFRTLISLQSLLNVEEKNV